MQWRLAQLPDGFDRARAVVAPMTLSRKRRVETMKSQWPSDMDWRVEVLAAWRKQIVNSVQKMLSTSSGRLQSLKCRDQQFFLLSSIQVSWIWFYCEAGHVQKTCLSSLCMGFWHVSIVNCLTTASFAKEDDCQFLEFLVVIALHRVFVCGWRFVTVLPICMSIEYAVELICAYNKTFVYKAAAEVVNISIITSSSSTMKWIIKKK